MEGKGWFIAVSLAFIIILAVSLHLVLGKRVCNDFECFSASMEMCTYSTYIQEETEASWRYEVKGRYYNDCEIKVTLIQAKEGDLKLRQFEGNSMICKYPMGVVTFPEKDLVACSGLLKENLQEIIIEKLQIYIVNNLNDIKQELNEN